MSTRLFRLALALVPPRWRAEVMRDLFDESPEADRIHPRLGLVWRAAAIGLHLRAYRAWHALPADGRRVLSLKDLMLDVRHACRSLRRAPWYASTVVIVVGCTIALASTAFAVVGSVLLTRLPYRQPDQLYGVMLGHTKLADPPGFASIAQGQWRAFSAAMPSATAFSHTVQADGSGEVVQSFKVDAQFFAVLGVTPRIGGFSPDDFNVDPRARVQPALLSAAYWKRRFASNPDVVGHTFTEENGQGIRVAGVLPDDFVFPHPVAQFAPDILTPLVLGPDPGPSFSSLYVLTRVSGSRTAASQAAAMLTTVQRQWASTTPQTPPPPGLTEERKIRWSPSDLVALAPIREVMTTPLAPTSALMLGAAVCLLLLASANIAGLALAHTRDRSRDLAMRRSLGAGTISLLRLLALEQALLMAAGAAAGVIGARPLLAVALRLVPTSLLFLRPPAIDARVWLFAAIAATICVAIATVASVRIARHADLRSQIDIGRAGSARAYRGFIIVQITTALVIVTGAFLVGTGLVRLWHEDPGFDVANTVLVTAGLRGPADAVMQAVNAVAHAPGVARAGGTDRPFLDKAFNGSVFDEPPGIPKLRPVESMGITTGYLQATGVRLVAGRLPSDDELISGTHVLVVTERTAHEYWANGSAIGQTLHSKMGDFTVVGVVNDTRYLSLDMEPRGTIYWPLMASPTPLLAYVVASIPDRDRDLDAVVAALRAACPTCRSTHIETGAGKLSASVRSRQFPGWLFSSFGCVALIVSTAGVLGLAAMATARRTKEIGIRLALGSTRLGVVRQFLREQIVTLVIGVGAGIAVAAWASRFVQDFLYKTTTTDPRAWILAVAAMVSAVLLGVLIPAARATRVDPAVVLRDE